MMMRMHTFHYQPHHDSHHRGRELYVILILMAVVVVTIFRDASYLHCKERFNHDTGHIEQTHQMNAPVSQPRLVPTAT